MTSDFVERDRAVPIVHHPIHALLVPVPVVCFTGALITDIVYSRSTDMQWANFSAWLLFVGIDVIGGMLTEINVTSPTGLVALDRFEGINSAGLIWDAIETKLAGQGPAHG